MLHRTTWIALPIVGAVVVGTGLGWWGYGQQRQKQALAVEANNQYTAAFHSLVSDLQMMHRELGESTITYDPTAFQYRLRNIWRLSDAAQTELSRLPVGFMRHHKTHQFLATIASNTDDWLIGNATPKDSAVIRSLHTYYTQSGRITTQLIGMQDKLLSHGSNWTQVVSAGSVNPASQAMVDGFKKLDGTSSAFVETDLHTASLHRPMTDALKSQPSISKLEAIRRLKQYVSPQKFANVKVMRVNAANGLPVYHVEGTSSSGAITGTVSANGGKVLSFSIDKSPGRATDDLAQAQQAAGSWLHQKGFSRLDLISSNEYAHIGYFVYTPVWQNRSVTPESIAIKVAMDNQQIVGFNARNYYNYPLGHVPSVRYSDSRLQQRLSPSLHVRQLKDVVMLDKQGRFQPATAFYGTANGETYCVYMNASSGKEMDIEQLTDVATES